MPSSPITFMARVAWCITDRRIVARPEWLRCGSWEAGTVMVGPRMGRKGFVRIREVNNRRI